MKTFLIITSKYSWKLKLRMVHFHSGICQLLEYSLGTKLKCRDWNAVLLFHRLISWKFMKETIKTPEFFRNISTRTHNLLEKYWIKLKSSGRKFLKWKKIIRIEYSEIKNFMILSHHVKLIFASRYFIQKLFYSIEWIPTR